MTATPAPVYDLVVDGALQQRIAPPDDAGTIRFTGLPAGTRVMTPEGLRPGIRDRVLQEAVPL